MSTTDLKIKQAAKPIMVLEVEETKSYYEESMSENEFLDQVYGDIPEEARTTEGVDYFKQVFYYHKNGISDDEIKRLEDGTTFLNLCNKAKQSKKAEYAIIKEGSRFPWIKVIKITILVLQGILVFMED